jgi:pyruvate dehydrogenase E1 component alpha subunit
VTALSEQREQPGVGEQPSLAELLHMYETMFTTTLANDRITAEVTAGRLHATFYPVRGLEGVCSSLGACLRPEDYLVSTYRNLGDALGKRVPLAAVIAEAYGRLAGTSKGKGGPMHLQDTSVGFMLTTGIVGSGLPIAVGLALAAKLDDTGRATAVTFGDGATSIGAYHEAMNLAALWSLPIVFVCQNNQWAEHTPIAEYAPVTDLAQRASSYGMTAVAVDGFDPIATWQTLRGALDQARAGGGPTFVECHTYRLVGHTSATEFSYMPSDELETALGRDAAPSFRRWLLDEGVVEPATLDGIEAAARDTVDAAVVAAEQGGPPGPEEQDLDVFAPNGAQG